jgi:DNA-binding winged helix-turn-helix (wHTH) protein/tetratricopeptide (TPR) repeat protein
MVAFPPFRLDPDQGRLWKGETLVALRRKPFGILCYLAAHPKKLVTQAELLAQVWGGAVVSDSAMRSHMHELRQVLGEGVIETVIGRGYRFVAEVQHESAEVVARAAPDAGSVVAVDPLVVGRDAELGILRAALERARAGRRQVCFVLGEPGIGKSTLVRTFLAGLRADSVSVARGFCFEQHGAPEPYFAVIDALGSLTRSPRAAQVRAALARHAPTFVAQVPQLVSDEQLAEVTRRAAFGNEARQLRELSEAIEALCAQVPLVLVLEDLQWSDVATIDLLSLLGQREQPAKLLVIATSRQAEIQSAEHPLNRVMRSLVARSGALALIVPKVDVAAVQSFLDRRYPGHVFPERLTDLVAKITGGTPLYMVSLLDELVGRGMLAEREGKWTLTVSIEDVQAHRPASVKQLIDMQLDRLSPAEQRVLEAASIVGGEFSTDLVAAALELPAEQVDDTCDALARKLSFVRAEVDARYAFTHALIQEVCAERSSPARRQRWHRLVAQALERDPRASEVSHLLAKHFEAAGEPMRAISAYVAAGRHAARRYATSDSVALCARALDLVPHLPEGRERDLLELHIVETICQQLNSNSYSAAFAGREPLKVYARAIEIARSLGDVSRLYGAITELCNYNMIVAQYDRTPPLTAELERIEQEHELEPRLLHAGVFARAYIAFFRSDFSTALRLFERLLPAAHDESVFHANPPGRALVLGHLACVHWVVGEPDRALEEAFATLVLANELEIPILQALGHVVLGRIRYLRRDPLPDVEEAALHAVHAASLDVGLLAEANAFALWAAAQRAPVAWTAVEPMLDSLRKRLTAVSTCSTLVALVLIDVLKMSGHVEQARALSDEIIAFAMARSESVYLPELLRMRGELLESTDPAAAREDYRKAIELARSAGARSLEQRATASLDALAKGAKRIPSRKRPPST